MLQIVVTDIEKKYRVVHSRMKLYIVADCRSQGLVRRLDVLSSTDRNTSTNRGRRPKEKRRKSMGHIVGKYPYSFSIPLVKEAVATHFVELMKERGIKTNELANRSCVTPSSVYSMLDPRRKEVSVNLVKKLCDGLDITLGEFFSAPLFDDLEQEIQ